MADPAPSSSPVEPETLIERRGRAGVIILNRPKALNALTLGMVREISAALDAFERDSAVERIVVSGSGGRAFCAGGDIRKLHDQGRAGDHAAQLDFWREEYVLNRRIKRYSKPYVALIDGIVMGGGVGLSLHGSHRIATETTVFAMPEVGIGFFPDVGATYLLPRMPHRLGVFLAVTGLRAEAGDLIATGLANAFTPRANLADLAGALELEAGPVEAILSRLAAPAPVSKLMAEAGMIAAAFASLDLAAIEAGLAAASETGSALALKGLAAMREKSPTSQAIALRQMQLGADMSFEQAMTTEFRIVSRIARGHDFYEGVRAVLVDKDNRPAWSPAPGEPLDPASIDAYFAPLGVDELLFPET